MLLTADAETHVMRPLGRAGRHTQGVPPRQRDPTLPTLLQRIRPRLAAIEVGAENTYGHPAPSTLAALTGAKPP